jgi:hypothetical protein
MVPKDETLAGAHLLDNGHYLSANLRVLGLKIE